MKIEPKRIGDSTCFIFPRDVATRFGIELGKNFYLTETANDGILITPTIRIWNRPLARCP
jgi:hypothetical protein